MDCSPSGSSVHGVLQARILNWVAVSFSEGSFQLRDQPHISLSLAPLGKFNRREICLWTPFFTFSPSLPLHLINLFSEGTMETHWGQMSPLNPPRAHTHTHTHTHRVTLVCPEISVFLVSWSEVCAETTILNSIWLNLNFALLDGSDK